MNAHDSDGDTALLQAVTYADFPGSGVAVLKLLLDRHADMEARDKNGRTALLRAAEKQISAEQTNGDDIVALLLARGANVQARDRQGRTALTRALEGKHADIVRLLRQAGARK